MDRVSKHKARYREGSSDQHCAVCTMYREPHSCTKVEGIIYPNDLCDYFERKPEGRNYGKENR